MTSGNTEVLVQTLAFALREPKTCLGNKTYRKVIFIPESELSHSKSRYQVLLSTQKKRD